MSNLTSKVNVLPIVTQYASTFRKYRSSEYDQSSIFLFLLLPLVVGILLPLTGTVVDKDLSGLLLGLYSVFAGLLFGTQIFIFEIISRVVELNITVQASRLRIKKLENVSYTVSFEILVCFLGLMALFLLNFAQQRVVVLVLSGVSFYLLSIFLLSLLASLKGLNILLTEEIKIQSDAIEKKFSKKG